MNEDAASNQASQGERQDLQEPESAHEPTTHPLYANIIVPLDGSTLGERALPVASTLAKRCGATLQLVRVLGENESVSPAAEYLEQTAHSLGPHTWALPPIVMDVTAWAIRETVSRSPNSLLCMSSHGRGGLGRTVLGNVAESVVQEMSEPVLLVGPHARVPGDQPWGAILTTFDGSERSEAILPLATDWADALGMRLILANVVDPRIGTETGGLDVLEANYVKRLAHGIRRPGVEVGSDVLHDRDAGKAIVRYAQDVAASVIAMTTHGRSGLARLVAGSTTMMVVHEAPSPVLVLRSTPAGD